MRGSKKNNKEKELINQLGPKSEYISSEGLAQIKEKLAYFKNVRRKEISERLEYAKGLGDLSENSEYHEAKEAQLENERGIMELEDIISRSVILTKTDTGLVSPGSTVVLERSSGELTRFILVGPEETDPSNLKISYESPLGRAVTGRKKNDRVKISTPKGDVEYKIIDIIQ